MAAFPKIKLTYFDIRGLAELARLTLAAAGVPFEDDRIQFEKKEDGSFNRGDWEQRKPNTPYGQVPVLTVTHEGVEHQIAQSGAIVRFIARHHNLEGHGPIETALVDAQFEALNDLRQAYRAAKNNSADPSKLADFYTKGLPEALAGLERNVRGQGHFLKSHHLTYVDLAIYYVFFMLRSGEPAETVAKVDAALNGAPKIKAITESVPALPKVAAYLAARKNTIF